MKPRKSDMKPRKMITSENLAIYKNPIERQMEHKSKDNWMVEQQGVSKESDKFGHTWKRKSTNHESQKKILLETKAPVEQFETMQDGSWTRKCNL